MSDTGREAQTARSVVAARAVEASQALQASQTAHAVLAGSAGSFVSVLLAVLLAAGGWPNSAQRYAQSAQVERCERGGGEAPQLAHAAIAREMQRRQPVAAACIRVRALRVARVLPRTRRVDSYGLPPPRAPTN
ncbi:MAG: hypothetical protein AB8H80_10050 [Planctomycetota bacterium]